MYTSHFFSLFENKSSSALSVRELKKKQMLPAASLSGWKRWMRLEDAAALGTPDTDIFLPAD